MGLKSYIKRAALFIIKGIPEYKTTIEVKVSSPSEVLKGRNILITGANRGLGYCFAKKCVSEGANVIITGRDEIKLKKAATELNCKFLMLDSSDFASIDSVFWDAEKMFNGKVDSLISNAGISLHEGNFRNVTIEGWDAQMDTNLKGNFFIVQKFIQYLESKDNKNGNIVVITSERAKRSDDIPYGLTKVATSSFIQCIANKVASEGIRINGVGPGVTATDMTGAAKDGNYYSSWTSGHRYFMPEEVAEVVNFLLSDISGCVSGEIITCDQASWVTHW